MRDRPNAVTLPRPDHNLQGRLARNKDEILAAKRLRYEVFINEMGAKLAGAVDGVEQDYFDAFCQHLIVVNPTDGQVVATTRILTVENARDAGCFYSSREFDLATISALPGNLIEVGRTCVRPGHRTGNTLGTLWSGLEAFIATHQANYLFGCASIPIHSGAVSPQLILDTLGRRFLSPWYLRLTPRRCLPVPRHQVPDTPSIPALVKTYLRLGAWICGEPCWDPEFGVADVFILLDMNRLNTSYADRLLKSSRSPRTSNQVAKVA